MYYKNVKYHMIYGINNASLYIISDSFKKKIIYQEISIPHMSIYLHWFSLLWEYQRH